VRQPPWPPASCRLPPPSDVWLQAALLRLLLAAPLRHRRHCPARWSLLLLPQRAPGRLAAASLPAALRAARSRRPTPRAWPPWPPEAAAAGRAAAVKACRLTASTCGQLGCLARQRVRLSAGGAGALWVGWLVAWGVLHLFGVGGDAGRVLHVCAAASCQVAAPVLVRQAAAGHAAGGAVGVRRLAHRGTQLHHRLRTAHSTQDTRHQGHPPPRSAGGAVLGL